MWGEFLLQKNGWPAVNIEGVGGEERARQFNKTMVKYHSPQEYLDSAKSPNTSAADLRVLAKSTYPFVHIAVAKHPNTEPDVLASLLPPDFQTSHHYELAELLAANPRTPQDALSSLAKQLELLPNNDSEYVDGLRIGVSLCGNPSTPLEAIQAILQSKSTTEYFRAALATEIRRLEVLHLLLSDPSEAVRQRARKTLEKLAREAKLHRRRYGTLRVKMTCPLCEEFIDVAIEIYFGDMRTRRTYTIGERCHWQPRQSVESGGRPPEGNLAGPGFTGCPRCAEDFFVKALVRDDIFVDVIPDPAKSDRRYHLDRLQPAQAVGVSPPEELRTPGQMTFNFDAEWLTDQRQTALSRLAELGVDIYAPTPTAQGTHFRIMIPHDLPTTEYIEIAYLIADLADEKFRYPPLEYVDSYPHGLKYRVYPK